MRLRLRRRSRRVRAWNIFGGRRNALRCCERAGTVRKVFGTCACVCVCVGARVGRSACKCLSLKCLKLDLREWRLAGAVVVLSIGMELLSGIFVRVGFGGCC